MLTDSRSPLSFVRHEMFRRILCDIVGKDAESGRIPDDHALLADLVSRVCYGNAKDYFGFGIHPSFWLNIHAARAFHHPRPAPLLRKTPDATCACTAAAQGAGFQSGRALGRPRPPAFFDPSLSNPAGQSCASCHDPATAFSDPLHRAISPGAVRGVFGTRNAPTLLYAQFVPPLGQDADDDALPPAPEGDAYAQEVREENLPLQKTGGLFADGRADSLEAQVAGPLFNPLEMNVANQADFAAHLRLAPYANTFADLVGPEALATPKSALHWASFALAAFERSASFAPFASRYDAFLAGNEKFTAQELEGLDVFENPKRGNCASCHPNRAAALRHLRCRC